MKTRSPPALTLCFALALALPGLAACDNSRALARDPRLDAVDHFKVDWPLQATTLDAAVAEVAAKIGPGLKRADGTVEWTARTDETHCARIQLKNQGGKLSANGEKLMKAHPDFAACIAAK